MPDTYIHMASSEVNGLMAHIIQPTCLINFPMHATRLNVATYWKLVEYTRRYFRDTLVTCVLSVHTYMMYPGLRLSVQCTRALNTRIFLFMQDFWLCTR